MNYFRINYFNDKRVIIISFLRENVNSHIFIYCTYGGTFYRMHLSLRSRYLRDVKSGHPLNVSQESGLRMIGDQDVLRASRVPLYVEKRTPIHPIRRHLRRSAQLSSLAPRRSRSLSSRAHCAAAPRRERTRWIYTCTRDIIAASSRHAALVRNGPPRTLLPSSCGRGKERKKRLEGTSVLDHLRSSAQNLRWQKGRKGRHHGLIVCPIDRSPTVSRAMTLPFANRKRKYGVKFPHWTSGSDLAVRS